MRNTALTALVVGAMLFGIVSTASVRSAAEAQASKGAGVIRVQNLLEVVPAVDKKRGETTDATDATIRRDLDRVLKSRAELRNVNVVMRGGIVRLSGARGHDGLGDVHSQPAVIATARASR